MLLVVPGKSPHAAITYIQISHRKRKGKIIDQKCFEKGSCKNPTSQQVYRPLGAKKGKISVKNLWSCSVCSFCLLSKLPVLKGWLLFVSGETWVHRMSFPVKTTESLTWCRKGLVLGLLTHLFPCLEEWLHVSFRGDRITRLFISAMKS